MSRSGRARRGGPDPTVADPDLLAGRLFFGVPVPGPARAPLEAALPRLEPLLPGARLAPPGGWHLTLAFLGQVQPEMADEVVRVGESAVAGVGPARLRLESAGTFPESGRKARVLWTGIGGDTEILVRLAAALSSASKAAGLRSEDRPLAPHHSPSKAVRVDVAPQQIHVQVENGTTTMTTVASTNPLTSSPLVSTAPSPS